MDYIIASFRSRWQALQAAELLKKNRVECYTINTPKQAGIGCGLSVKFLEKNIVVVKAMLKRVPMDSFIGFFAVSHRYGKMTVTPY